jgi:hypothetical protein
VNANCTVACGSAPVLIQAKFGRVAYPAVEYRSLPIGGDRRIGFQPTAACVVILSSKMRTDPFPILRRRADVPR